MWDIKETSPSSDLQHGHTVVGTTPVSLTPVKLNFVRGIMVRSPGPDDLTPNTDVIWIGRRNVTPDQDINTGGFPLLPGAAMEIPCEDPSQVFAVSGSEGQDLAWMGV
jgi:hypothetical protein